MGAAAVTAWWLVRSRPAHRPAAVALSLLAALLLASVPLSRVLPSTGENLPRALVYLEGARMLGVVAVPTWLALRVTLPERRWLIAGLVAGLWLLSSVLLAALYPSPWVRGLNLEKLYFTAEQLGVFVSVIALVRHVRNVLILRDVIGSSTNVAMMLVALNLWALLVPRDGSPDDRLTLISVGVSLIAATIAVAQGIVLWVSSKH